MINAFCLPRYPNVQKSLKKAVCDNSITRPQIEQIVLAPASEKQGYLSGQDCQPERTKDCLYFSTVQCIVHFRSGSRPCKNPYRCYDSLTESSGEVMKGFVQGADRQPADDVVAGMPRRLGRREQSCSRGRCVRRCAGTPRPRVRWRRSGSDRPARVSSFADAQALHLRLSQSSPIEPAAGAWGGPQSGSDVADGTPRSRSQNH